MKSQITGKAANDQASTREPSVLDTSEESEDHEVDQSPAYSSEDIAGSSQIEPCESSTLPQNPDQDGDRRFSVDPPSYELAQASSSRSNTYPSLCILFQVVTSRENIGSYISIAHELLQSGHRVRIATFRECRALVENYDIEFFDIGGESTDVMECILTNLHPNSPNNVSRRRQTLQNLMELSWQACIRPGLRSSLAATKHQDSVEHPFVADAIIASPLAIAHAHCAEKLGVPVQIVSTIPFTPTSAISHPLSTSGVPRYSSYVLFDRLLSTRIHDVVNKFRRQTLNLEPLDPTDGLGKLDRLQTPTIYCWSENLLAKPKDWNQRINVCGLCPLPPLTAFEPPVGLDEFLQNGNLPIYVHLPSIPDNKRHTVLERITEAVQSIGARAIIRCDFSDMDLIPTLSGDLFPVEECPLDLILQRVSCVIHDGGSDVSTATLIAGKASVVIPVHGYQVFWAKMVAKACGGPSPLSHRHLKRQRIVSALELATSLSCQEAAMRIAADLRSENGPQAAQDTIMATISSRFRRCSLDPSRIAVWRFVQNGRECRVSTLAAATLAERQQLNLSRVERMRNVEFTPSAGPAEPLIGSTLAVSQLLYNGLKGCTDILSEFGNSAVQVERLGKPKEVEYVRDSVEEKSSVNSESRVKGNYKVGSKLLKGSVKIVKATARSPGTFTLALAQGTHNAPRLWGDSTVREPYTVTGISSGLAAGCKGLVLGTYDGIAGLVTQPCIGAKEGGVLGATKGVGKGLAGLPVKFFSAACAPVGYPLKGIDAALTKDKQTQRDNTIDAARVKQGKSEHAEATLAQKQHIIQRWIAWQQGARFE